MAENSEKFDQLNAKLDNLIKRHELVSDEISELRVELDNLKNIEKESDAPAIQLADQSQQDPLPALPLPGTINQPVQPPPFTIIEELPQTPVYPPPGRNIEKFIGENLISKIGISVLVIGIAIGVKYSIDHRLISPLTRIMLGYLAGITLFGIGIRLKEKYENYSAVLVSGAIATAYFITFFAYDFYNLIPQLAAFGLMVVFTAIAIAAALKYNMQVIAHFGLVGAYAVPFLLSNNSGNAAILFSYISIINTGILTITFRKYWKPICYSSFGLSWLIYYSWFATKYDVGFHFSAAIGFLTVFFILFYITLLAYKLIKKEKFDAGDVILLLSNSFIYFGVGYTLLEKHPVGEHLQGLFSFSNALVHAVVAFIVFRKGKADRNLGSLVAGLALVFITIAVPVQLDGSWVTLLWAGEAALLFRIGRTKGVAFYELLSYPVMVCAFFSLMQDWKTASFWFDHSNTQMPFLNISFLSSLLFAFVFLYILILFNSRKFVSPVLQYSVSETMSYIIPGIFLIVVYYSFWLEIANYWDKLYAGSEITNPIAGKSRTGAISDHDLLSYKAIWILNYSLIYLSVLTFMVYRIVKNEAIAIYNLGLNSIFILVFLTLGLYTLSELRESYLHQIQAEYYSRGIFNIWIRYISLAFVALILYACYRFIYRQVLTHQIKMIFELMFHITVIWITSSELVNRMDIAGSTQSYKLGLSLLWGLYSLLIIVFGIWKRRKHLRFGAIVLFACTLVKLVFYDVSLLDTISKTIVFISLGVLLLIISFLYNKFKHIIADDIPIED